MQTQIPFGNDKKSGQMQMQIPFGNDKKNGQMQMQIPFGNDKKSGQMQMQIPYGNDKRTCKCRRRFPTGMTTRPGWERSTGMLSIGLRWGWGDGINDVFNLRKRVEFHAEWLRDEPFDATTTGQLPGTGVNSLLDGRKPRGTWDSVNAAPS